MESRWRGMGMLGVRGGELSEDKKARDRYGLGFTWCLELREAALKLSIALVFWRSGENVKIDEKDTHELIAR